MNPGRSRQSLPSKLTNLEIRESLSTNLGPFISRESYQNDNVVNPGGVRNSSLFQRESVSRLSILDRMRILSGQSSKKLDSPDLNFYADSMITLKLGPTAYRWIEPMHVVDDPPIIVCLHGLYSCSYMWGDAVDLLW
jgi:hypothetical protein